MELAPSKFNCAVFGWDWDWETQDERNLWSIWGRRHKSTAESCRGKQWNRTGEGRGKCWAGIQDRLNILRTNKQHLRAAVRTKSHSNERKQSYPSISITFCLTYSWHSSNSPTVLTPFLWKTSFSFFRAFTEWCETKLNSLFIRPGVAELCKAGCHSEAAGALWPGTVCPAGKGLHKSGFCSIRKVLCFPK